MWDRWNMRVRDSVLFIVGVVGVRNELWIVDEPRAYALIFLGGMIGMPFVLGADKFKQTATDDTPPTKGTPR